MTQLVRTRNLRARMFVLGHLGFGERMARPFVAASALPFLLLGAVLPDLVDKPLYYVPSLLTGRHGAALGLISGTRTFGHTLLAAGLAWLLVRGPRGRALFAGMLTHLFCDVLGDTLIWFYPALGGASHPPSAADEPSLYHAIFFPLLGVKFPYAHTTGPREHLLVLANPWTVTTELIGAVLLFASRKRLRAAFTRR